jgi:hypothetical protein
MMEDGRWRMDVGWWMMDVFFNARSARLFFNQVLVIVTVPEARLR